MEALEKDIVKRMEIRHFGRKNLDLVEEYLDELKIAYKRVFEGPPWYEDWPLTEVDRVVRETILEKETVYGSIMFLEEKLSGFAWVYGFIDHGKPATSPTVDFESVMNIIERNGYEPREAVYLAEFGVLPEEQFKGYGRVLLRETLREIGGNGVRHVFYRTINPVVKHLCDKLEEEGIIREHRKDVFSDPTYPDRQWQLVVLK